MCLAKANESQQVAVLKVGGSLLRDVRSFTRVAEALAQRLTARPRERLVVVVSAQRGLTDALGALAQRVCPAAERASLDLLWSTGELRSVALLTLALHQIGLSARGLNVHECGIRRLPSADDSPQALVNPLAIQRALRAVRVVVVPGFLARGPGDCTVTLGRNGSDLSAVLLASALGAPECELLKDFGGYRTADPRTNPRAQPLAHLCYADALARAQQGCGVVQLEALRVAEARGVALLVRGLAPEHPQTRVGHPPRIASREEPVEQLVAHALAPQHGPATV